MFSKDFVTHFKKYPILSNIKKREGTFQKCQLTFESIRVQCTERGFPYRMHFGTFLQPEL